MPIYEYEHIDGPGSGCSDPVEFHHGMNDPVRNCPRCGSELRKIVSRFSKHRNVLSTSNIKEKGFTRLRRRDKGVYEPD